LSPSTAGQCLLALDTSAQSTWSYGRGGGGGVATKVLSRSTITAGGKGCILEDSFAIAVDFNHKVMVALIVKSVKTYV
jgi:hypothetical protein